MGDRLDVGGAVNLRDRDWINVGVELNVGNGVNGGDEFNLISISSSGYSKPTWNWIEYTSSVWFSLICQFFNFFTPFCFCLFYLIL